MKILPPDHKFFSNRCAVSKRLFGLVAIAAFLHPSLMRAGFDSVFTAPPYTLDETIAGIDGWEMVNKPPHPVYTDPMMAIPIQSPIANAVQPTTLSLHTLLKNMQVSLKNSATVLSLRRSSP